MPNNNTQSFAFITCRKQEVLIFNNKSLPVVDNAGND